MACGNTLNVQSSPITQIYGSRLLDAVGGARIQAILSPGCSHLAGDAGGGGRFGLPGSRLIGWKLKEVFCTLGGGIVGEFRPAAELFSTVTIFRLGTWCDDSLIGLEDCPSLCPAPSPCRSLGAGPPARDKLALRGYYFVVFRPPWRPFASGSLDT